MTASMLARAPMPPFGRLALAGTLLAGMGITPSAALAWDGSPFTATFQGSPAGARPGDAVEVRVRVRVPPGHFVYRESLAVEAEAPEGLVFDAPLYPHPKTKKDPFSGDVVEVYKELFEVVIPGRVADGASSGTREVSLVARFQGCNETICFFPQEEKGQVTFAVEAVQPAAAQAEEEQEPPSSSPQPPPPPPAGASPFSVNATPPANPVPWGETFEVLVTFHVPPGHFLYRDRLTVRPGDLPAGLVVDAIDVPRGKHKPDPFAADPSKGGFVEILDHPFDVAIRGKVEANAPGPMLVLPLTASFQGCNATTCFFPESRNLAVELRVAASRKPAAREPSAGPHPPAAVPSVPPAAKSSSPAGGAAPGAVAAIGRAAPEASAPAAAAPDSGAGGEGSRFERMLREQGLFWVLLLAYLAGLGLSFSPCVFPMIPITVSVFGTKSGGGVGGRIAMAAVYVLTIAILYALLGVVFASTGKLFGSLLGNPWFNGSIAVVFLVLALGLFGAYELTPPAAVTDRLGRSQGSGLLSAFSMGVLGSVVFAPCVGPFALGILTFIAVQGSAFLGFWMLFVFALGIGTLFFLLALFSSSLAALLPKAGLWMVEVKHVFGWILIGMAIYQVRLHVSEETSVLAWSLVLIAIAVFQGGLDRLGPEATAMARVKKLAGILALVAGLYGTVGVLARSEWLGPPLRTWMGGGGEGDVAAAGEGDTSPGVVWLESEADAAARAAAEGKPLLLDFWAQWCVNCKVLEKKVFEAPAVAAELKRFVVARVDLTRDDTPESRRLKAKYDVRTLPLVVIHDGEGRPFARIPENAPENFYKNPDWMRDLLRRVP